jgi:type I restriction enzyme S subunit
MSKWNLVSLKEIVNNLDNKRVPLNSSQRELKESKPLYPYIGANNIMGYIDEYIFDEKILCVAEDGGSWGYNQKCAVLYNEKVWVNNHAHVITAKENLVLEYLMYYLNHTDLNLYINGATRGKLTKSSLESIQVPLPPLPQQQKIANILDAADALRQNDKVLIAKYDVLTQALFLDMFGDLLTNSKGLLEVELGKVLELITYGLTVRPNYVENGIPLISAREIRTGKIELKRAPKISQNDFNKLSDKGIPKINDILFSKTGSIGHCALVETTDVFAITQNAARLTFKKNINPIYAMYYLKSSYIQQLSKQRAKGNAVKDLQLGDMKKFKFICPVINTQNQFAERVTLIEEQKAIAQKSLEHSESLFNSLLQKAFKGEL